MRTYTRIAHLVGAAALLALLAAPAGAARRLPHTHAADSTGTADSASVQPHHILTPEQAVDELLETCLERMDGTIQGSDTMVAWDAFRNHPQRTVELIMPTLRPVRRGLWLGAPNMVWRIRVLQRLTGLSYTAPTRATLGADEARFLAPDSTRRVPFAGEYMERGITYVAPADAQKAIIDRWRKWWASDVKKPDLPIRKHDDDTKWWW